MEPFLRYWQNGTKNGFISKFSLINLENFMNVELLKIIIFLGRNNKKYQKVKFERVRKL